MIGRPSRLTPEQWNDLVEYYQAGHTLTECGKIWGLSQGYIGIKLKKMNIKIRGRFEPSRPEKWDRAPPHTQAENVHVVKPVVVETPASEGTSINEVKQPRRVSSRRKIIAITDSDKKAQMLYEKEF
jgi:hypothetical protein